MIPIFHAPRRSQILRRRVRTHRQRCLATLGIALVTMTLAACGDVADVSDRPSATATAIRALWTRVPAGNAASNDGPQSDLVEEAEVVEVIDGDTVRVRVDGDLELVRMTGVDTPEVSGPYRREECYGDEASRITADLVPPGSFVALERDVSDRDPYDRLLRSVWTIDRAGTWTFINEAIVASGAAEARAYPPDTTYADRLERAETEARAEGVGMWSACSAAVSVP